MAVFTVVIDMCLLGGLILAMPFFLFFLGQFVAPALTKREMKVVVPAALVAFRLFSGARPSATSCSCQAPSGCRSS